MAVKSGLRDMEEIKDFYDKHAYGGHLFDEGDRITHMRDANTGEVGKVGTVNEDGTYNVLFSNGVQPMVYQGPEVTVVGKLDRSKKGKALG